MTDSVQIDETAPFDAHTYYAGLRAIGVNPCIRQNEDGGMVESAAVGASGGVTGDVGPLACWAMAGDSDWTLRKSYVLSVWQCRPDSDLPVQFQRVPLGM